MLGSYDTFSFSSTDSVVHVDGGASRDTPSYSYSDDGGSVSLLRGRGWEGEAKGDTFVSIEDVVGSNASDTLTGDHGNNTPLGDPKLSGYRGERGDDTFMGNGGNDYIFGGGGNDRAIYSQDRDKFEITFSLNDEWAIVT